jgi:hypothetical protein
MVRAPIPYDFAMDTREFGFGFQTVYQPCTATCHVSICLGKLSPFALARGHMVTHVPMVLAVRGWARP